MIGGALERHARVHDPAKRVGQFRASRVKYGNMVQAGRPRRRRLAARALPCVEADVVMIAAGLQKRGLRTVALRDGETEHIAVERKRAIQVGHLQMDVADPDF